MKSYIKETCYLALRSKYPRNPDKVNIVIILDLLTEETQMRKIKIAALLKFILILPIIIMSTLRVYKNCLNCEIPSEVIKTQAKPYWPWLPGYKSDKAGNVWPLYFTGRK